jgi:hypothetical protein
MLLIQLIRNCKSIPYTKIRHLSGQEAWEITFWVSRHECFVIANHFYQWHLKLIAHNKFQSIEKISISQNPIDQHSWSCDPSNCHARIASAIPNASYQWQLNMIANAKLPSIKQICMSEYFIRNNSVNGIFLFLPTNAVAIANHLYGRHFNMITIYKLSPIGQIWISHDLTDNHSRSEIISIFVQAIPSQL